MTNIKEYQNRYYKQVEMEANNVFSDTSAAELDEDEKVVCFKHVINKSIYFDAVFSQDGECICKFGEWCFE